MRTRGCSFRSVLVGFLFIAHSQKAQIEPMRKGANMLSFAIKQKSALSDRRIQRQMSQPYFGQRPNMRGHGEADRVSRITHANLNFFAPEEEPEPTS